MEHNKLTQGIKHILIGAALVSTWPVMASTTTQTDNNLNTTAMTGSRLAHADDRHHLPVMVYTREDMLRSGENNVADFIRSLPVNTFGSFRPQSGSTAQENSLLSLRGIGSSRSLILIDGRRMPKSTTTASGSNLNLIPMGAVERIEVLAAGSSAIYGTDAIGGVVNVITRKDFQGAEIMLGGGNPSIPREGGERESGSVMFGASSDRSKIIAGVSWNDREIVFERDVPWPTRGASVYGNSFTTITDGFDNFDWTSFVGACDFPGTAYYTVPNSSSSNGTRCAYDFSQVAAEDASTENKAFYVHASHQLNDQWTITANTLFSQTESFGRYAPVPDSSFFSTPLSINSPNNPTNPNSPLYDPSLGLEPQEVNWWHRFDTLGNRDSTVQTQWLDMTLSVAGTIGAVNTEFGIRQTDNNTADVGRNYLLRSAAQALIEDGSYSLLNPYAAPESILNQMRFTTYRDAKYDQDEVFATIDFEWFELNGGAVQVLIGAEYLSEKYFDLADPQSQAGQVGGTAGSSAFANRDTQSLFVETHVPLFEPFSINLAGRYDDYSDLGDDLAGKISLGYQPLESLSVQAAYSTNHQTPNLDIMNSFSSTSLTSVRDFQSCFAFPDSCNLSVLEITQSNPFLKSELSDEFNVVVNYNPKEWMSLTVRYWDLEIDNRLRRFSAQDILNLEVNGLPVPPGLGCDRTPAGAIIQCITGFTNDGSLDVSGIDLNAEFKYPLFNGTVTNQLVVNHMLDLKINNSPSSFIGTAGYPENRASLYNNYAWKNWNLAYNIHMIGEQEGEFSRSFPAPNWVTHDVQISYELPWQSNITVGALNVGEKFPPIRAGFLTNRDYDFNLYNGFGRIVYARYTQTF